MSVDLSSSMVATFDRTVEVFVELDFDYSAVDFDCIVQYNSIDVDVGALQCVKLAVQTEHAGKRDVRTDYSYNSCRIEPVDFDCRSDYSRSWTRRALM